MSVPKRRSDDVKIRCTKCGYTALVPRLTHQDHIARHRTRWCPETRIREIPKGEPIHNRSRAIAPPPVLKQRFCPECREPFIGSSCFVCGYEDDSMG